MKYPPCTRDPIGISLSIFCLTGMIADIIGGGNFSLEHYRFTRMVIGSMIVGMGFGLPSFIYRIESVPMPVRVIIHMGTGCIIYTVVAYAVGWMGGSGSIEKGLAAAAVQTALAFMMNLEKVNVVAADGSKAIAMFKLPGGAVIAHGSQQSDRKKVGREMERGVQKKEMKPESKSGKKHEKAKSR